MLKRFLFLAVLLLAAPVLAQDSADPPLDPNCPREGSDRPTGIEWLCNGRLTPDYAFAFVYPAAARQIPALNALLREQAVRDQARVAQDVATFGRPAIRYSYGAEWRMDSITPELAAASGTVQTFRGGPHGGLEYRAILIDRRADRQIRLNELFAPNLFETSLLGRTARAARGRSRLPRHRGAARHPGLRRPRPDRDHARRARSLCHRRLGGRTL